MYFLKKKKQSIACLEINKKTKKIKKAAENIYRLKCVIKKTTFQTKFIIEIENLINDYNL